MRLVKHCQHVPSIPITPLLTKSPCPRRTTIRIKPGIVAEDAFTSFPQSQEILEPLQRCHNHSNSIPMLDYYRSHDGRRSLCIDLLIRTKSERCMTFHAYAIILAGLAQGMYDQD